MPASTSETAARLGSSPSVDSIFSERMAFIGSSPVSRERGCPPHDEINVAPSVPVILTASRPICGNARSFTGKSAVGRYQLRLKPAERLLLVAPCGVSPTEAERLTPANSFCSAPILQSHLSSVEDSVWPAVKLVPVSVMLSLADCPVS